MNWESRLMMPNGLKAQYQKAGNTRYYKLVPQPSHHTIVDKVE
ncbi:hypothetical protein [Metabacillus litoralis]|nr:hypothetical protein [Metabacillus litoralis]